MVCYLDSRNKIPTECVGLLAGEVDKVDQMASQVEKIHFTVTGEFLTRHTRNLMLEGEWEHALKTLSEGLVYDTPCGPKGISFEDCISVLDGYKRLEGRNEANLVDEDPEVTEKYRKELDWLYGLIVNIREGSKQFKWYRPYAYVTNFGHTDIHASYGIMMGDIPRLSYSGNKPFPRASHYLNDRNNDVTYYLSKIEETLSWKRMDYFKDSHAFLFEPCEAPPFWFVINRKPISGIEACVRTGRILEERGHQQWYHYTDCDWDTCDAERKEAEIKEGKIAGQLGVRVPKRTDIGVHDAVSMAEVTGMARTTGLEEETVESMLDVMRGEADDSSKPKIDPHFTMDSGWVLRDGTYYSCKYYQHRMMARRILLHTYGVTEEEMPEDTQLDLEHRGAIRIQKSATGESVVYLLGEKTDGTSWRVTKRQLDTVQLYCNKYNKTFPKHFLD